MPRFEQLVVSDHTDDWGVPRCTGTAIVNIDEITTIRDATANMTYQSFFSPYCPTGIYAAVQILLRSGTAHTLVLGQFHNPTEADTEIDRFTTWLTGHPLLD